MNRKKLIGLVTLLLIALIVALVTTSKTYEMRDEEVKGFSEVFLPLYTEKCLKKNHYSVTNPTAEQKAECEAFAKTKWEEVSILNQAE